MQADTHSNPIDRISHAESVIALLGRVNADKFPADERMAVASVQIEAIDQWLAAYLDVSAMAKPRTVRQKS